MSTASKYVCNLDSMDWKVAQEFEANFRWEYADGRDALLKLYRKGKRQPAGEETEQQGKAAACLEQDDERQERAGDARRLHVSLRAGITEHLVDAGLNEDDRHQHAADGDEIGCGVVH